MPSPSRTQHGLGYGFRLGAARQRGAASALACAVQQPHEGDTGAEEAAQAAGEVELPARGVAARLPTERARAQARCGVEVRGRRESQTPLQALPGNSLKRSPCFFRAGVSIRF